MVMTEDAVYAETVKHIDSAPSRKGFSGFKDRRKVVTVEFDGMTGDVWYRPWVITPRVLREMVASNTEDGQDNVGRLMDQIILYVDRWEVNDEQGRELPVTLEVMEEHMPTDFLAAVIRAIRSDMEPTPTTGDASSAG